MTSHSSMSKLSEVTRQHRSKVFTPITMYSVRQSNISMKLHVKCTVPVGSSSYTQKVTFAWSLAEAKAVSLASGGETIDYFCLLPNESWITEIFYFFNLLYRKTRTMEHSSIHFHECLKK